MIVLQRYEMHTTQAGSKMRRHDSGEWCDSDDVEKLERELDKAKDKLERISDAFADGSLDDVESLEKINRIIEEI
jgi:hypothetical protein